MWTLLKEFTFEDRAIRLYRSNSALRVWRVETEYKTGEKFYYEKEEEEYAWWTLYTEGRCALTDMARRHCPTVFGEAEK